MYSQCMQSIITRDKMKMNYYLRRIKLFGSSTYVYDDPDYQPRLSEAVNFFVIFRIMKCVVGVAIVTVV